MRLAAWRTVWRDIEFDPTTGRSRRIVRRVARDDAAPIVGFADRIRSVTGRRWTLAVYLHHGRLFFSAGARRWSLDDDDLGFTLRPGRIHGVSRFDVTQAGNVVYTLTYPHFLRTFMARLDPGYDAIDFEADYFTAFLVENATAPAWRDRARGRWQDPRFRDAPRDAGPG